MTASPLLTNTRRQTIRALLNFFINKGLDYNPFFYYIEGSAHNEQSLLLEHAATFSESILRLHMMDNAHFLSTGEIKTDEDVFELYKEDYGTNNFLEIAATHAQRMVRPVDFELEWRSKISYASLLKIALIHRTSRCGVGKKYEEFRMFMENTFNIALGTERYLALLYFSGQFEHFIPVQKGANPTRMLARLRAAAWDILLLNFPAHLLAREMSDGIYLGFPCSSDRALCAIGHAYSLEAVMAWAPHPDRAIPIVNYDFSALEKSIGAELVEQILTLDAEWQNSRRRRDLHSEKHVSLESLEELTKELEQRITSYCKA